MVISFSFLYNYVIDSNLGIKKIRHFVIRERDKNIKQGTLCTLMCSQSLWFIFARIFLIYFRRERAGNEDKQTFWLCMPLIDSVGNLLRPQTSMDL